MSNLGVKGVLCLCRALGRDPPSSNRVTEDESAPTKPSTRSLFGWGGRRGSDDETSQLMSGPDSAGGGDLDSIFARMEDTRGKVGLDMRAYKLPEQWPGASIAAA